MLFSVKSMTRISVNDAMIEAGMASDAMITARRFRMKIITTMVAKQRCRRAGALRATRSRRR